MKLKINIMGGIIILPILFIGLVSVYYVYSDKFSFCWDAYWVTLHDICIALLSIIIVKEYQDDKVKSVFKWIMVPYISFKSIYDILCFTNLTIFTVETWDKFWKIVFLLVATIFCLILFFKINGKTQKRLAYTCYRGFTFISHIFHDVWHTIIRRK